MPASGTGSYPFALVETPRPEIDAVALFLLPAADQGLQLTG